MQNFLISVVGVVLISLIVEVIFPAKTMRGAVALSFSLAVIFILVGGLREIFKKEEFSFPDVNTLIQDKSILDSTIKETESRVESYLVGLGYEIKSVELRPSSRETKLLIGSVVVNTKGDVDEEKLKDEIIKIVEVERENIWVQN